MTSAFDLLDGAFPHGTPEGFRQGCKGGGACTGVDDFDLSCAQAHIRYAGDWTYRGRVDQGFTPAQIHQLDADDVAAVKSHRPAPVKRRVVVPDDAVPEGPDEDEDVSPIAEEATIMPTPTPAPSKPAKPVPTAPPASGRSKEELARIREWATANGFKVADRGRIPAAVIVAFDAYDDSADAGHEHPEPVAPEPVEEPTAGPVEYEPDHPRPVALDADQWSYIVPRLISTNSTVSTAQPRIDPAYVTTLERAVEFLLREHRASRDEAAAAHSAIEFLAKRLVDTEDETMALNAALRISEHRLDNAAQRILTLTADLDEARAELPWWRRRVVA